METLQHVAAGPLGRVACARHETGGESVVLFCHGFRGERTGPNRIFVRVARRLAALGISSLRFDQVGSGDSDGEFVDSRFDDWVATIRLLARRELAAGRRVALLGHSMGASAAICAAAHLPLSALVAWMPDANVDAFQPDPTGLVEEGGQRVATAFWEQAHAADVPVRLAEGTAPTYLLFGTADEYVSAANRQALVAVAKPTDRVDVLEGWPHSAWTADQADDMIGWSTDFSAAHLTTRPG